MISRAESAYWRLLVDETNGNHRVAETYLIEALRARQNPDEANVVLFRPPQLDVLDELTDLDIFVLITLLVHDGLSLSMISRALNSSMDEALTACRHLSALGIVLQKEQNFYVNAKWHPQVNRFLKNRRFLHTD